MSKVGKALALREIQLASLRIYKRIANICAELGLRHWVMYGTLIGAVRHQGFIPWDDDFDIAMPRPDYERLLAYFDEHSVDLLPLIALRSTRQRPLPFMITRISDMTYRMVGEFGEYIPELGAFVDVYPMDGLGIERGQALRLGQRNKNYMRKALFARNFPVYSVGNGPVKRAMKMVRSMVLGNPEKYELKLARSLAAHTFDESEWCFVLWQVSEVQYRTEWFTDLEKLPFEDLVVPVPQNYDYQLRLLYGDYMRLPPESERVGHHVYSIIRRQDG